MIINVLSKIGDAVLRAYCAIVVRPGIISRTTSDASIICTTNAEVFNHGSKDRIILRNGVVLDGTLECYEKGFILIGSFTFIGRSRIFSAHKIEIGR
jgi:hypothetical protein